MVTNDGPFQPSDFQQMTFFDTFDTVPGTWTFALELPPFTFLSPASGHPSISPLHWTVRRWESDINGDIILSGNLGKTDTGDGDGIIGRIFLDDTEVFTQPVAATDTVGFNYSLNLTVNVGSTIDLVIDPGSSDFFDSSRFTGIVVIPEPNTALLMGVGMSLVLLIRTHRRRPTLR